MSKLPLQKNCLLTNLASNPNTQLSTEQVPTLLLVKITGAMSGEQGKRQK